MGEKEDRKRISSTSSQSYKVSLLKSAFHFTLKAVFIRPELYNSINCFTRRYPCVSMDGGV